MFELAANQGHAESQRAFGSCLMQGIGVTRNETDAFKYFKLAADQNLAEAQRNVGLCYDREWEYEKTKQEFLFDLEFSRSANFIFYFERA